MDNIENYISKLDDLLVFCDPDYKNQIYKKIESNLKINGKLKGEALTQMINSFIAQYEEHLKKPENQINLRKFVQIASENFTSIRNSPESILVAGKLNILLFQYKKNAREKEFTLPFFATLQEKAETLEQDLKKIYSKDELSHYFMTENFTICEPVKQTLRHLTPIQVNEYAKNNVFHLSESMDLFDFTLDDLIKTFSDEQREAFFQGITEMRDKKQSFRQLFCCLNNIGESSFLVFERFPKEYFIKYINNNLGNIKDIYLPNGSGPFLALNGIIIQGRLNPVAEIVILDAVKNNNYLKDNDLLIYMKLRLGLKDILVYKGLTADQISTFQSNSTVNLQFEKQKKWFEYL